MPKNKGKYNLDSIFNLEFSIFLNYRVCSTNVVKFVNLT